ncbi:MAG: hypothetical protein IPK79_08870 [Vampirovibrionales bacterium]|nr:hypothetical protein [Vampirovibrionales bacterium]
METTPLRGESGAGRRATTNKATADSSLFNCSETARAIQSAAPETLQDGQLEWEIRAKEKAQL